MTIAAIDQGTTSSRILFLGDNADDGRRKLVHALSLPHRQNYPKQGWVEHDGNELLGNVKRCLDAVEGLAAVGLANQGESCLAWDAADGSPLGPVIVWQDERTADVTAAMEREGCGPEVMQRAGLPLDPYFSASKLGWIVRNIPRAGELASAGRLRLGTTDAFFRQHLTGRFETDIATASRTSLMNIETGEWDEELCRLFGVPVDALPPIGPTSGALGDLPGGARLAASIVDQQAALYGHGCRKAGDAKITFGTGAFAQCVTDGLRRPCKPGPLPTVAWQQAGAPVTYALDGGVYAAAAAINWAQGIGLFAGYGEIDAFDAPPAIDRGMVFMPALAGLGCPHWDRRVKGSWLGLELSTGPLDMMQAILEGIAMRSAEVIASMEAEQPIAGAISIDGGLSKNQYFTRFLAEACERQLKISDEPELTAAGLIEMAAEAVGKHVPQADAGRIIDVAATGKEASRRTRFAAARQALRLYAGSGEAPDA